MSSKEPKLGLVASWQATTGSADGLRPKISFLPSQDGESPPGTSGARSRSKSQLKSVSSFVTPGSHSGNDFTRLEDDIDAPNRRGGMNAASFLRHMPQSAVEQLGQDWGSDRLTNEKFIQLLFPVMIKSPFFDEDTGDKVEASWLAEGWLTGHSIKVLYKEREARERRRMQEGSTRRGSLADSISLHAQQLQQQQQRRRSLLPSMDRKLGALPPEVEDTELAAYLKDVFLLVDIHRAGQITWDAFTVYLIDGITGHKYQERTGNQAGGSGGQVGQDEREREKEAAQKEKELANPFSKTNRSLAAKALGKRKNLTGLEKKPPVPAFSVQDAEFREQQHQQQLKAQGVGNDGEDEGEDGADDDVQSYLFRGEVPIFGSKLDKYTSKEWYLSMSYAEAMDRVLCISRNKISYVLPCTVKEQPASWMTRSQLQAAKPIILEHEGDVTCAQFLPSLNCTLVSQAHGNSALTLWHHAPSGVGKEVLQQGLEVRNPQVGAAAIMGGYNADGVLIAGANASASYQLGGDHVGVASAMMWDDTTQKLWMGTRTGLVLNTTVIHEEHNRYHIPTATARGGEISTTPTPLSLGSQHSTSHRSVTGAAAAVRHTDIVTSLYRLPHSGLVLSTSMDGSFKVFDPAGGIREHSLHAHQHGVTCASFQDQYNVLVTAGFDSHANVWADNLWGKPIFALEDRVKPFPSQAIGVHTIPATPYLAVTDASGMLKMFDLRNRNCVFTLEVGDEQNFEAGLVRRAHLRGQQLTASSGNGEKQTNQSVVGNRTIFNSCCYTGEEHRQFFFGGARVYQFGMAADVQENPSLACNADKRLISACCGERYGVLTLTNDAATMWSLKTGMQDHRQKRLTESAVSCNLLESEQDIHYLGHSDGLVSVHQASTGIQLQQFHGHEKPVVAIANHPSEGMLATVCKGQRLCIWLNDDLFGPKGRAQVSQQNLATKSTPYQVLTFNAPAANLRFHKTEVLMLVLEVGLQFYLFNPVFKRWLPNLRIRTGRVAEIQDAKFVPNPALGPWGEFEADPEFAVCSIDNRGRLAVWDLKFDVTTHAGTGGTAGGGDSAVSGTAVGSFKLRYLWTNAALFNTIGQRTRAKKACELFQTAGQGGSPEDDPDLSATVAESKRKKYQRQGRRKEAQKVVSAELDLLEGLEAKKNGGTNKGGASPSPSPHDECEPEFLAALSQNELSGSLAPPLRVLEFDAKYPFLLYTGDDLGRITVWLVHEVYEAHRQAAGTSTTLGTLGDELGLPTDTSFAVGEGPKDDDENSMGVSKNPLCFSESKEGRSLNLPRGPSSAGGSFWQCKMQQPECLTSFAAHTQPVTSLSSGTQPFHCIVSCGATNVVALDTWDGLRLGTLQQGPLSDRKWTLGVTMRSASKLYPKMRWLRLRRFIMLGKHLEMRDQLSSGGSSSSSSGRDRPGSPISPIVPVANSTGSTPSKERQQQVTVLDSQSKDGRTVLPDIKRSSSMAPPSMAAPSMPARASVHFTAMDLAASPSPSIRTSGPEASNSSWASFSRSTVAGGNHLLMGPKHTAKLPARLVPLSAPVAGGGDDPPPKSRHTTEGERKAVQLKRKAIEDSGKRMLADRQKKVKKPKRGLLGQRRHSTEKLVPSPRNVAKSGGGNPTSPTRAHTSMGLHHQHEEGSGLEVGEGPSRKKRDVDPQGPGRWRTRLRRPDVQQVALDHRTRLSPRRKKMGAIASTPQPRRSSTLDERESSCDSQSGYDSEYYDEDDDDQYTETDYQESVKSLKVAPGAVMGRLISDASGYSDDGLHGGGIGDTGGIYDHEDEDGTLEAFILKELNLQPRARSRSPKRKKMKLVKKEKPLW